MPSVRSPHRRPALLGELAVVAFLLVGYDRVAALAGGHAKAAVRHGADLLRLERALHVAVEHRLEQGLLPHPLLGRLLSVYYDFAHGTVTVAVLAGLYVFRPDRYRHARRVLVAVNGLALVVFAVLPVAPPRLLPGAGFADVVAHSGTWGSWEASDSSAGRHADLFASLPSLHVASATWVVLAVFAATRRRWLQALAVAHLLVTVAVVLSTGNHYVVDVVAGAALSGGLWRTVPGRAPLDRRGSPPARPEPRGAAGPALGGHRLPAAGGPARLTR